MRKEKDTSPNIVRRGLVALRKWRGYDSAEKFVHAINLREHRDFDIVRGTSPTTLKNIESNAMPVPYDYMERIQDETGVAVGSFLSITHLTALLRDGKHDDAKKFADGLIAIANEVSELGNDFDLSSEKGLEEAMQHLFTIWKRSGLNVSTAELD